MKQMKVLNLYACLGGNRFKWDEVAEQANIDLQVTAVELDPELAKMYQERFPNDIVIVADAHEYLLKHYSEFDFIWSSPPCQTHSRANYFINYITESRYPKMELWQEIIFLKTFFKGKFCVENVISYYQYFIPPTAEIGRHYLWSNFTIPQIKLPKGEVGTMMKQYVGTGRHAHSKKIEDRNAVNADLGLHILNRALDIHTKLDVKQGQLF